MEVLWRSVDVGQWLPTRQSIGILRNARYSQCKQRPRWSLLQLSVAWQRRQFLALRRGWLRLDRASGLHERSLEVQRGRMDVGRGSDPLGPECRLRYARRGPRRQHSRGPARRSDLDGLIRRPVALCRLKPQYGGLFERYLEIQQWAVDVGGRVSFRRSTRSVRHARRGCRGKVPWRTAFSSCMAGRFGERLDFWRVWTRFHRPNPQLCQRSMEIQRRRVDVEGRAHACSTTPCLWDPRGIRSEQCAWAPLRGRRMGGCKPKFLAI